MGPPRACPKSVASVLGAAESRLNESTSIAFTLTPQDSELFCPDACLNPRETMISEGLNMALWEVDAQDNPISDEALVLLRDDGCGQGRAVNTLSALCR